MRNIIDKIFKIIYGEDIYLLKVEYLYMSRLNIFYKYEILNNLNYILLDLIENNKKGVNNKEMRKIINMSNNLNFKEMREYIKKDIFFSL